jgi:hypothetical protein
MALARPGDTANPVRAGLNDLSAEMGIFAVQHLRIRQGWLNSMQPENVAYFVCKDLKSLCYQRFYPGSRSSSGASRCQVR